MAVGPQKCHLPLYINHLYFFHISLTGSMDYECRYCLEDNAPFTMIQPCKCSGTNSNVHIYCLVKWLWTSQTFHCPVCKQDFKNRDIWYFITQLSYISHILLEFCGMFYDIIS
jgi:hypothetical protein